MSDDITPHIQAKSDQLNADDLVGGPITVRITRVEITGGTEQPVTVHIDGDHKPWKPCKTTMRVLAFLWGARADQWVGRSVRLFRDPTVKWGGVEVGGIRISALSHLDGPKTVVLQTKKGSKAPHRIEVLAAAEEPLRRQDASTPATTRDDLLDGIRRWLYDAELLNGDLRAFASHKAGRELPPVDRWGDANLRTCLAGLRGAYGRELVEWSSARAEAALNTDPRTGPMDRDPMDIDPRNPGDDELPE